MVWDKHSEDQKICEVQGNAHRLIQDEEESFSLVDSIEEEAVLEEILNHSKPPYVAGTQLLDNLIKNTFRVPPLEWGSRFGTNREPSIFYGGKNTSVALAESAYYRFVFIHSMIDHLNKPIQTEHTLFRVPYKSDKGVRLYQPPFDQYTDDLIHQSDYSFTQRLGEKMRKGGIEAFEYLSARCKVNSHCVGIFSPNAFMKKKHTITTRFRCQTSLSTVTFKEHGKSDLWSYIKNEYTTEEELPLPSA